MKKSLKAPFAGTVAALAALSLSLTGCTNSGNSSTSSPSASGPVATDSSSQAPDTQQSVQSTAGPTCDINTYGAPKLNLKDMVVGFSQSEKEDNPFRIAETQSIKDEAAKVGVKKLIVTNSQSTLSKQISDIQDMLNQGIQALILAPLNSDGLEPALKAAKAKHVPVITIDRMLTSGACDTYVTFIGSNFVEQGKRAADQLIAGTGGKANVAVLLGASGNGVTTDRTKGFMDEISAKGGANIKIVAQQTGEFVRDKGRSVTEQLLQAHPEINAIYAENDEMGLGAQAAIVAAGKNPGTDVQIYSIDGTKNAVSQIVAGKYNGVIESNPRFGPLAFKTLQDFESGTAVGQKVVISDGSYDKSNASATVNKAY